MGAPHDMTRQLIDKLAGVGAGQPVAQRSWCKTLELIRGLPVFKDKEN